MIDIQRRGTVAVLVLQHGKANAMDTAFFRAFADALDRALDSDARSVVLTATGSIFCAGVDLPRLLEGGSSYLQAFLPALSAGLKELFAFPRPVVAAINGHAIAGGCILACACDHRIMAEGRGRIGVPELRVGVPFPLVPLEIVRHAVPPQHAQHAILTGRAYEPAEALTRGFVDELVPPDQLVDRATAVALEMSDTPSMSFARAKRDLRRPVMETLARFAATHDRDTLEAWDSPEVRRAVAAFVDKTLKREPRA